MAQIPMLDFRSHFQGIQVYWCMECGSRLYLRAFGKVNRPDHFGMLHNTTGGTGARMPDSFWAEVDGFRAAGPMTTFGVRNASHELPRGQGVEGIVENMFCAIRIDIPFGFDRSGSERAAP